MTAVAPPTTAQLLETELRVDGMTCGACAARVERALRKLDGVQANVNYATGRAAVPHSGSVTIDDLVSVVERAGYTARAVRNAGRLSPTLLIWFARSHRVPHWRLCACATSRRSAGRPEHPGGE